MMRLRSHISTFVVMAQSIGYVLCSEGKWGQRMSTEFSVEPLRHLMDPQIFTCQDTVLESR